MRTPAKAEDVASDRRRRESSARRTLCSSNEIRKVKSRFCINILTKVSEYDYI